jgi:hypothetical protein
MIVSLLFAAEAHYFLLRQKVTKSAFLIRLLCRTSLCPAERPEPRAGKVCPFASHALAHASAKYPMPHPSRHQVLPALTRS